MAKARRKQEGKDLKKHSSAVQVQNNITLLQRKTWNALLWHAYDDLPTKDIHQISVQQIMRLVGYDSKDEAYLKEATRAMLHCRVEWDVLGKSGSNVWGAAVLLASVEIENGICSYGFAPHLRQKLYNPDMFARLDLDMQRRFDSKHALALWELCTDYLGSKRDEGETRWMTLEEFRTLLGIARDEYTRFNNLTLRVINPAIAEINSVSDFRVTVEYQRQGRKVIALKFKMRRVVMLPEAGAVQIKMFPDLEDMPAVVAELKAAGLSTSDAWEIWQKGFGCVHEDERPTVANDDDGAAFLQYVREKIHLLKRRRDSGKVENSTGFLIEAIRENYSNPEYALELQSQAAAEARQSKRERENQVRALEAQKAALDQARDKELDQLSGQVAAESPGVLDQAAAELLTENLGFRQFYKRDKTALENYQSSKLIQAFLNDSLERHRPEPFQAIKQDYAARIAAIDAQISSLDKETGG